MESRNRFGVQVVKVHGNMFIMNLNFIFIAYSLQGSPSDQHPDEIRARTSGPQLRQCFSSLTQKKLCETTTSTKDYSLADDWVHWQTYTGRIKG
jgi:hypothetical protein